MRRYFLMLATVDTFTAAWAAPRLPFGVQRAESGADGCALDGHRNLSDVIWINYNIRAAEYCHSLGPLDDDGKYQSGFQRSESCCRCSLTPQLSNYVGRIRAKSLHQTAARASEPLRSRGFHATARSYTEVIISVDSNSEACCPRWSDSLCREEEVEEGKASHGSSTAWIVETRFVYTIPEDYFIEYSEIDLTQQDAWLILPNKSNTSTHASFRLEGDGSGRGSCTLTPMLPERVVEEVRGEGRSQPRVALVGTMVLTPSDINAWGEVMAAEEEKGETTLAFDVSLPLRVRYSHSAHSEPGGSGEPLSFSSPSDRGFWSHRPLRTVTFPQPSVEVVIRATETRSSSLSSPLSSACTYLAEPEPARPPLLVGSVPCPAPAVWLPFVRAATSAFQVALAVLLAASMLVLRETEVNANWH